MPRHSIYLHQEIYLYHYMKIQPTKKIQQMEDLGVISRVKEPTQWYAAMVILPKPSGSIL